jgi:integrase
MASNSFVLKEPDLKGKDTIIYLLFRFNSKRIKMSTKEKIESSYWDTKKQRVRNNLDVNFQEINNNLNLIEKNSITIYHDFKKEFKREPKTEELKTLFSSNLFKEIYENTSANRQMPFFEFFENFITVRKENKKVSPKRIYIYNRTIELLKDYQKDTKDLVAFERFNERFSVKFRRYLEQEKNYSANTVQKNFKVIRAVLNNAYAKNYTINREYKLADFMPEGEESFEIALSIEELEALHKFDFSDNKKLERTRDLFVVGCYTGLRFSDFSRLGKEHLKDEFLSIVPEKTRKKNPLPIIIPVLPPVKEIFEKYNYNLPNNISNQKMNQNLKEMAKKTKLFEDFVTYHKVKGGKKITISHPKHNEIVTHCARRTYCTMSYKIGIPTQSIMKISGHRTEKSFLRYLKVTNEDHANRASKIWEDYYNRHKKVTGKTITLKETA